MNLNPGPNNFELPKPHTASGNPLEVLSDEELKDLQDLQKDFFDTVDEKIEAREDLLKIMRENLDKVNDEKIG